MRLFGFGPKAPSVVDASPRLTAVERDAAKAGVTAQRMAEGDYAVYVQRPGSTASSVDELRRLSPDEFQGVNLDKLRVGTAEDGRPLELATHEKFGFSAARDARAEGAPEAAANLAEANYLAWAKWHGLDQ